MQQFNTTIFILEMVKVNIFYKPGLKKSEHTFSAAPEHNIVSV